MKEVIHSDQKREDSVLCISGKVLDEAAAMDAMSMEQQHEDMCPAQSPEVGKLADCQPHDQETERDGRKLHWVWTLTTDLCKTKARGRNEPRGKQESLLFG